MRIIAFEGHDNSGKSTLAEMLSKSTGYELIKFPNEKLFSGQRIRAILNKNEPFEPASFQALQDSNKKETLRRLDPTKTYIFDRFKLSEIVYGLADGLPEEWVRENADLMPDPDVTVILVGVSYGNDGDIYSSDKHQEKIKELYKQEGKKASGNVIYVLNEVPIKVVFEKVYNGVKGVLL